MRAPRVMAMKSIWNLATNVRKWTYETGSFEVTVIRAFPILVEHLMLCSSPSLTPIAAASGLPTRALAIALKVASELQKEAAQVQGTRGSGVGPSAIFFLASAVLTKAPFSSRSRTSEDAPALPATTASRSIVSKRSFSSAVSAYLVAALFAATAADASSCPNPPPSNEKRATEGSSKDLASCGVSRPFLCNLAITKPAVDSRAASKSRVRERAPHRASVFCASTCPGRNEVARMVWPCVASIIPLKLSYVRVDHRLITSLKKRPSRKMRRP
mmetsp:Transcript_50282/g.114123  ORF Transcript_50282/g.114123 Transcript_50282/m.114123 type:complete len:272 (+) Transcript_50282:1388-2203(+)